MTHYDEDELVLFRYGESADSESVRRHLDRCDRCAEIHASLERTLALVDHAPLPERGERYPDELWERLQGRLDRGWLPRLDPRAWFSPRRLALAGGVAMLVVVAFLAGRQLGGGGAEPISREVRERVLLATVVDHLERSQRLLVGLVNADPAAGFDLSAGKARAETLASSNRLYRQTAASTGEAAIADVLDELERLLIEIANSPATLTASELNDLRLRIESRGLLLKIEVLGRATRQRGGLPAPAVPRDQV